MREAFQRNEELKINLRKLAQAGIAPQLSFQILARLDGRSSPPLLLLRPPLVFLGGGITSLNRRSVINFPQIDIGSVEFHEVAIAEPLACTAASSRNATQFISAASQYMEYQADRSTLTLCCMSALSRSMPCCRAAAALLARSCSCIFCPIRTCPKAWRKAHHLVFIS